MIEITDQLKRIPLHIEGLDENMQGGVPEGHTVLICGAAGVMKTSLSLNVLYHELQRGKSGLFLSLEQTSLSILSQMGRMGYDLSKIKMEVVTDAKEVTSGLTNLKPNIKGKLTIIDFASIRNQLFKELKNPDHDDWQKIVFNVIEILKKKGLCDIFVLDSLSAYYVLAQIKNPREHLFDFFEKLKFMEITSFVICEMPVDGTRIGQYGVEEFLADGVIIIQLVNRNRKMTREINIMKMRATNTTIDIYSLEFKNKKFQALYGGEPPLV